MAYVDWRIKGPQLSTCNCNVGCPCQFNALPTHGDCRAAVAMRIDEGHFGDVSLAGLHWAVMAAWPGATHEGNGECLPVVEERADADQRRALLTILSGAETAPGATIFNVFATTFATVHPPQFRPIIFAADIDARIGSVEIPGLLEAGTAPIRNPVTGAPHRVRVVMPDGFEYREAEFAQGDARAGDPMPLSWTGGHAHLCTMHMTPHGPVG